MRLVVLTGQSGAGLTTARLALEDLGYFAVDNLPPVLWAPLLEELKKAGMNRAAVVLDVRARAMMDSLPEVLNQLDPVVVFLEARAEVLLRRYNLSRRLHPLGLEALTKGLEAERAALAQLRDRAHLVVDTSERTPRQLKETLELALGDAETFVLRLLSFGFKHGPPSDADAVLDVRAFPNPHWDPQLGSLPGTDARVASYVFANPALEDLYQHLYSTVAISAQSAREQGRAAYSVALGCTGGRHRSVAVTERLARELASRFTVRIEHRDLDRGSR